MHEEFSLQHEVRYLALFGLTCYGCCEPLTRKLEMIFRMVPRLRRVSISPWADVGCCAEQIGKKCILSWKPNPAILAGTRVNEAAIARELREGLAKARGCTVEIIMKDTHTVRSDPRRIPTWVRLARAAAEAAG